MERKRHLKIGISSYTDTHTVLGVTGNAEFSGIVTALEFHGDGSNLTNITADAGAYASTAGFATVAGYAHTAGIATNATNATVAGYAHTAGIATNATTAGSATTATAAATAYSLSGVPDIEINNLVVSGISSFNGDLKVYSSNLNIYSGYGQFGNVQIGAGNDRTIRSTLGNLILQSNSHQVEIQDDVLVSGIVTANGFVGPLTGNVTGDVTGDLTGDVNAGIITAVTGNFTGNVTIGGTLTYEDVTNVDSIGIVTARDGIVVNTRGIHVLSGITTLQDLDARDLNIRNITGAAATFTDSVSLYDNDKIFLGTSQEMEIFHGTLGNSFFTSTKPLYIKYGEAGQTHEMFIQNDSTTAAKFTDDASVELYYNGGKKLETVGGGVTVTGDLRVTGVVTATRFESTSSGTPSIDSPNNLDLNAINVAVSTDMSVGRNLTVVGFVSAANFYGDGSGLVNVPAQSYVANAGVSTYAETAGIATLAEGLTGNPDISVGLITASGSILRTGAAGTVRLDRGDGNFTGVVTATTFYGDFQGNGSGITGITATYADSAGIATYASTAGVSTAVTLVATNLAGGFHYLTFVDSATGNEVIRTDSGLKYAPDTGELNISGGNVTTNSAILDSLSVSGLAGIGSINVSGISTFQSHVHLGDDDELRFGAGNDFKIYHDPDDARIENSNGDIKFKNTGSYFFFDEDGGQTLASFINDGAVNLYYDGDKKFETIGAGVTVFGTTQTQQLNVSGVSTFVGDVTFQSSVNLGDNDRLNFKSTNTTIYGDSNGLNLEASGSNDINIKSNASGGNAGDVKLRTVEGGRIELTGTGGVGIYHTDTALKLETTGVGVTVFGTTETQQLNVSGISTFIDGGNGEIKVYEDSGDPIIEKTGGGSLHFKTNNGFDIENGTDYLARYGSGGGGVGDGVSLFHNGLERIGTTNAGAVVTGILTATQFSGDGSALTNLPSASGYWVKTDAGIHTLSSVGIGTTNPIEALDVHGTLHISKAASTFSPHLELFAENSSGGLLIAKHASSYPDLEFRSEAGGGSLSLFKGVASETVGSNSMGGLRLEDNKAIIFGNGNDSYMRYDPTPGLLDISTVVSEPIIFGTNETERVRITGVGSVGIGSTQPTAKLDVSGDVTVTGTLSATTLSGDGSSLTGISFDLVNDTSPMLGGDLNTNSNLIQFPDSGSSSGNRVTFGDASDLSIYHDGTRSYIHNDTGDLRIESDSSNSNDIQILNNNTTSIANHSFSYSAKFISGGSVELYEAGSKKFETTGTGVTVTGSLGISSDIVATGVITATTFYGDGSQLTGLAAGGASKVGELADAVTFSNTIGIGTNTLSSVTTGQKNTALGINAGDALTEGSHNVIVGTDAGGAMTVQSSCVLIGREAGKGIDGMFANNNVAVGAGALGRNSEISGGSNIAIGQNALIQNSSGSYNIGIGDEAADVLTTGANNTIIGKQAGDALVDGSNNLILGASAEASATNTSNEITLGDTNITKFRIPGIGVTLVNNSTLTDGHVLTVDSNGEAKFAAAGGGIDPVMAGMIF